MINSNKTSRLLPYRYIDPSTRDFRYDASGRYELFNNQTSERVYIALAKILLSSDKLGENKAESFKNDILNELQFLIDEKKIGDVSIDVRTENGTLSVKIDYYNLENKQVENISS